MSGVGVQWEADLRPLRDLEAPCGLHIGPWGKVGWDGSLVGICGNPPAQQVALFSGVLHAHQYALCMQISRGHNGVQRAQNRKRPHGFSQNG